MLLTACLSVFRRVTMHVLPFNRHYNNVWRSKIAQFYLKTISQQILFSTVLKSTGWLIWVNILEKCKIHCWSIEFLTRNTET